MKINIVGGTGLMGKVHKPIFEKQGHEVILSGRKSSPSLEEATEMSDLTIVSVPIPVTEETIRKVAPYATALMDFTSLKSFPIKAMLDYSNKYCEVGGLHPLYGEVKSLEGRTVVYCETKRSGVKCNQIVNAFQNSGLNIKRMDAKSHDLISQAILQNGRTSILESFLLLIKETGLSVQELYEISPPPTKILIDLVARQVDEKNDELYQVMRDYNPSTNFVISKLGSLIKKTAKHYSPREIRGFLGKEFLEEAQARAKRLIN